MPSVSTHRPEASRRRCFLCGAGPGNRVACSIMSTKQFHMLAIICAGVSLVTQAVAQTDASEKQCDLWMKKAAAMFPQSRDLKHPLTIEARRLQTQAQQTGDSFYRDPRSLYVFVLMAAADLGIPPANTIATDSDKKFIAQVDAIIRKWVADYEKLLVRYNDLVARWNAQQESILRTAAAGQIYRAPSYTPAAAPTLDRDREASESVRQMNEISAAIARDNINLELHRLNMRR